METKANYVLIGAFTIILIGALLLFGLWAAKYSSERTWQQYEVVFREAVTGLSVGSPVQYNGISVGSITKLSLAPNDPRQVIALIRVESTTPIKTDTRAKLAITSLTGPTIIQLSGGTPQAPALTSVDKREAPVIQTAPSALQNITDTANRIVERLDQVLSDRNVASIAATLQNLEVVSGSLASRDEGLQSLVVRLTHRAHRLLLGMPRPIVAIGDGSTDLAMRPAVDAFVAFTGFARRTAVVQAADGELLAFHLLPELTARRIHTLADLMESPLDD